MKLAFYCTLMIMLAACGTEPKVSIPLDRSLVIGEWSLVYAERNGKSTETLDSTYFDIAADSMRTNIFGEDDRFAINWNDSLIYPVDSVVTYKVASVTADTLNLSFDLQRFNFNIFLEKQPPNE